MLHPDDIGTGHIQAFPLASQTTPGSGNYVVDVSPPRTVWL